MGLYGKQIPRDILMSLCFLTGSVSLALSKATFQSHQPSQQVALVTLKEKLVSAQNRP